MGITIDHERGREMGQTNRNTFAMIGHVPSSIEKPISNPFRVLYHGYFCYCVYRDVM
jgi:hypothetical protein